MIHKIVSYLSFLIQGKTKYSLQSPFVHDFIERVLEDKEVYYSYIGMDYLKRKLAKDKTNLEIDGCEKCQRCLGTSKAAQNSL